MLFVCWICSLSGTLKLVWTRMCTGRCGTAEIMLNAVLYFSRDSYVSVPWSYRCGPNWIISGMDSSCYQVIVGATKNWVDARADCLRRGSDLVSIDGPKEQTFLQGKPCFRCKSWGFQGRTGPQTSMQVFYGSPEKAGPQTWVHVIYEDTRVEQVLRP